MASYRTLRLAAVTLLFLEWTVAVQAQPSKVIWDPLRTTSPDSVDELKALQERVKEIVARAMPSTVGLIVGSGPRTGAGSGVIVSDDGLVLTAAHVITDMGTGVVSKEIYVTLPDGSRVKAKPLGVNGRIDSGMIQITDKPPKDAKWPGAKDGKWPAMPLGKADDLKAGQWVVAMGHPGGPKPERPPPVRVGRFDKITSGAVSFVRTDCTLVGGDSGGPLYDLNGKVIGIHSQIRQELNYNLHVPIESFKKEWDKFVKGDLLPKPAKAELGVALAEDDSEDPPGPKIEAVNSGSPAAKAELKKGDIIVKFNKKKVESKEALLEEIGKCEPGQKVEIEVKRDKVTKIIEVTLGGRTPRKPRSSE